MKYKVLGNSSLPEIRLGLSKGQVIDVDAYNSTSNYEITKDMLKRLEKSGVIEKIAEDKPKREKGDG